MLRAIINKISPKQRQKQAWAASAQRFAKQLQQQAETSNEVGVGKNQQHSIVISLTSYHKRIDTLHLVIESLLRQTQKPDKIILWLSTVNFPDKVLPELLLKQTQRGLEIQFVDEDIGPYKKFYYTLQQYSDSLLITVDDDVLYPNDLVAQLYQNYLQKPDTIHCCRGRKMNLNADRQPLPYKQWDRGNTEPQASPLIFPTGVAGVLYFPGALHEEVLNKEAFLSLCPNTDDIWLKAMSLKNNVACQIVADPRHWRSRFLYIEGSQAGALYASNQQQGTANDDNLQAVFDHYQLYQKLTSC